MHTYNEIYIVLNEMSLPSEKLRKLLRDMRRNFMSDTARCMFLGVLPIIYFYDHHNKRETEGLVDAMKAIKGLPVRSIIIPDNGDEKGFSIYTMEVKPKKGEVFQHRLKYDDGNAPNSQKGVSLLARDYILNTLLKGTI